MVENIIVNLRLHFHGSDSSYSTLVVVLQDGGQQPREYLVTHQLLESHVPLESSTVLT